MKIERASPADFRLLALHAETFPHDREPAWSAGAWWLAFDGEDAVAFAGVQPSKQFSDCGYLVRAGVLPAWRGRGLQRDLIRVRERYARRQGWAWLITATHHNLPSANSLIACGYRLYEPSTPWLASGSLYWRKRLP